MIYPKNILWQRCLQHKTHVCFWDLFVIFWMQCFISQEMWGILHFVYAVLGFVCNILKKKRQSFGNACKQLKTNNSNMNITRKKYNNYNNNNCYYYFILFLYCITIISHHLHLKGVFSRVWGWLPRGPVETYGQSSLATIVTFIFDVKLVQE